LEVRGCFDAEDWGYVIEASLLNPLQDLRFPENGKILMKVDTGFTGPVLVTNDVFEFLRLSDIEVPDEIRPTYRTLAGAFTLRSAPAILEVNGKQFETDILAPLLGPSKLLIGCKILRELNLALLGRKTCFVSPRL
jgi:predicted aspartyl protease